MLMSKHCGRDVGTVQPWEEATNGHGQGGTSLVWAQARAQAHAQEQAGVLRLWGCSGAHQFGWSFPLCPDAVTGCYAHRSQGSVHP